MRWPQMIMVVWLGLTLIINLVDHGKEKTDTRDFGTAVIVVGIFSGLLWWGGFWG